MLTGTERSRKDTKKKQIHTKQKRCKTSNVQDEVL